MPPPHHIVQWLSSHLFPTSAASHHQPVLYLLDCPQEDYPVRIPIVNGYPDLLSQGPEPGFTQTHLHIDGHPATILYSVDTLKGKPIRVVHLFVYEPEHAFLHTLWGYAEESDAAWFHRETEAIIASFHIVKTAANTPKSAR